MTATTGWSKRRLSSVLKLFRESLCYGFTRMKTFSLARRTTTALTVFSLLAATAFAVSLILGAPVMAYFNLAVALSAALSWVADYGPRASRSLRTASPVGVARATTAEDRPLAA